MEGDTPPQSFEEYIEELLKVAIQAGISYSDFWEMTVGEISLIVDAYNKKQVEDYKIQLSLDYQLAANISHFMGRVLNGKQIPSLQETYPSLFSDENEVEQKEDKSLAFALQKEQFLDYIYECKKMRGDKSK